MAIPEFQCFMLPVLTILSDGKKHSVYDCIKEVTKYFQLSDEEMKQLVPSGTQTIVANRTYWSLTYLKKSLLIQTEKRGVYEITERGRKLLKTNPKKIDKKLLSQYEEYRKFSNKQQVNDVVKQIKNGIDRNKNQAITENNKDITKGKSKSQKENIQVVSNTVEEITPEENIEKRYREINEQLADELLDMIMEKDPYYFERLVMDVLTKMGYGNQKENSAIITPKTNDGGIDGIINQDRLGLDKIYVQAKRWKSKKKVPKKEVQSFAGALAEKKSKSGIFITTSEFSKQAKNVAKNLSIRLINGKELVNLMIEYNVGVQIKYTYELKKIDNDYFEMI